MTRIGLHITWFLGKPWRWTDPTGRVWHDAGAQMNNEGPYASGLPISTPGIAFPNNGGTLGGWWEIEFKGLGMTVVARQVDIGPKKPVVDLSAPLAYAMFGVPSRLVDSSPWVATYLGQKLSGNEQEGVTKT
jgi:hypothetical protein